MGNMGDAPFFGYFAKRGYQNARTKQHTPSITTFVQQLNLRNSTVAQIIARMWHNARPRKVGALTWLTLNNGLSIGTWLQIMGIPATCKGYDQGLPESAQHCLMECIPAQQTWNAFIRVWSKWEAPNRLHITWPFILLGEPCLKRKTTPWTSIAITQAAAPIDGNRSTSSGAFCSTTSGPKDATSISTAFTPSKGSCSKLGRPQLRLAWPLGKPSGPLIRIGIRTIIEQAFKAEWLHGHIFGEGEAAISWHLLPPFYFLNFSND